MNRAAPDVAVVGAGVVGLCSALALQRSGASTLLVRPADSRAAASFGNAGHVAVEQVLPLANPAVVRSAFGRLFALGGPLDFRLRDSAVWGPWAWRYLVASRSSKVQTGSEALEGLLNAAMPAWRRLAAGVGRPELLIEGGHLVVWERGASARAGRAHWRAVPTGGATVREMSASERGAVETATPGHVQDGVAFDGTAQVSRPGAVLEAAESAFRAAGGEVIEGEVNQLRRGADRLGLELHDREIWPGLVVVAAGVGAGRLMRGLGHAAPVVAERGYHVEIDAGNWPASLPPVVFEDRSMIVTRFEDRLRAAGFVEFARPDAPPDPRKWRRLERHLAELGRPLVRTPSRWVGSRPTLPDYLPAIGRSRRAPNLIYAFGHQHLGLTLGPLTGELVADLARDRAPAVVLDPFDLTRFDDGRRKMTA